MSMKKNVLFLIIGVSLMLFIGFLATRGKKSVIEKQAIEAFAKPSGILSLEKVYNFTTDIDEDGLSDAKEIIYGSDPYKTDTDGDGFSDGDEIRAGFDPTIPGKSVGRLRDDPNASLSVQYFSWAQQQTGDDDPSIDENSIEAFLQEKGMLNFSLPFVSDHEIIFTNDDPKKIKDYLAMTSSLNLPERGSPFLALARDVVQNSNLETLFYVTNRVDSSLTALKKTGVPASLKELHRRYLGIWSMVKESFDALGRAQQDPVGVLLAQKRGEWLLKEIGRVEDERAQIISDLRLRALKGEGTREESK